MAEETKVQETSILKKLGKLPFWQKAFLTVLAIALLGSILPDPPEQTAGSEGEADSAETAAVDLDEQKTQWVGQIASIVIPCNDAVTELGQMDFQNGTALEAYSLAAAVDRSCDSSWSALNRVDIPTRFSGAVEEQAETALEACQIYALRAEEMGEASMVVFDGDTRPSAVTKVTDLTQRTVQTMQSCMTDLQAMGSSGSAE